MDKREIDELHELLMEFQDSVLQGEVGSPEDRALSQAISIVEEYL